MVNGVIARKWKTITSSLTSGGIGEFVRTPPPKDVLLALTESCINNTGLLHTVGYTNILNVPGLVNSKPVQDGIKDGEQ